MSRNPQPNWHKHIGRKNFAAYFHFPPLVFRRSYYSIYGHDIWELRMFSSVCSFLIVLCTTLWHENPLNMTLWVSRWIDASQTAAKLAQKRMMDRNYVIIFVLRRSFCRRTYYGRHTHDRWDWDRFLTFMVVWECPASRFGTAVHWTWPFGILHQSMHRKPQPN